MCHVSRVRVVNHRIMCHVSCAEVVFGLWYSSQPGYCMWGMLVFKQVFGLICDPTTMSCVTCQKWSTTVSRVMCHVSNKSTTRIPRYMCPAPTSVFVCILDGYCILTRRLLRQLSQTAIMSANSPDKEEWLHAGFGDKVETAPYPAIFVHVSKCSTTIGHCVHCQWHASNM